MSSIGNFRQNEQYVSIGYSNQGTMTGRAVSATPATTGADHHLELSFTGTLAAKGDPSSDDQFSANVTVHTASFTGTVDVTNDYSYDGGATGLYEKKITLYGGGKLIWGTEPESTEPARVAVPGCSRHLLR